MEQTKIYQTLMSLLCRHAQPDEKLVRLLYPLIKQRIYNAKDIFIPRGKVPNRLAYLCEGAAVSYSYDGGTRRLINIWKEDELIIQTSSMLIPRKSDIDIVFSCESQILEINIKDLYKVKEEQSEMISYFNHFLRSEIMKVMGHLHWLYTTDAKKRIEDFQQRYKLHNLLLSDEQKAQYLKMSLRSYQQNKQILTL